MYAAAECEDLPGFVRVAICLSHTFYRVSVRIYLRRDDTTEKQTCQCKHCSKRPNGEIRS